MKYLQKDFSFTCSCICCCFVPKNIKCILDQTRKYQSEPEWLTFEQQFSFYTLTLSTTFGLQGPGLGLGLVTRTFGLLGPGLGLGLVTRY